MKILKLVLILFMMQLIKFVHIVLPIRLFQRKKILVSFIHMDGQLLPSYFKFISFLLVYVRASPSTSLLFTEYLDLIEPLANIDNIQILNEEPTADQKEYINLDKASSSDYKLYFKSK